MLLLTDEFIDAREAGQVVGALGGPGARTGVDHAGTLAVDHGALRFGWFPAPGWDRAAVAYGPFPAEPGLVAAVRLLPGLPTSQIVGERPIDAPSRVVPNLAIGWYDAARPADPATAGAAFVVDAHDGADARLLAGGAVALERMQNVVFDLVLVVRADDVLYLVASHAGVAGAAPFGSLRPVAVGPRPATDELFLGLHVRVLGEVDYQLDARVHEVRVARLDPDRWGPLDACSFVGRGPLDPSWAVAGGVLERGPRGLGAARGRPHAARPLDVPLGLLRASIALDTASARGHLGIHAGARRVHLAPGHVRIEAADVPRPALGFATSGAVPAGHSGTVEITDDGERLRVRLDGTDVCDAPSETEPGRTLTMGVDGPGFRIEQLEAYPRTVDCPPEVRFDPPWDQTGDRVVWRDDFDGPRTLLDDPPAGAPPWHRLFGAGRMHRGGGRVVVAATRDEPNPGRTLYALPWTEPDFADLEVEITAPGTARGTGHMARGGFVVWESPLDYVIVNFWLDDGFHGSSVSMFVHANGSEPPWEHDAMWTNAGARIQPGRSSRLRLATDGDHFFVRLDDEPVLWRRRSDIRVDAAPLAIRAVGLAANWEWGDDTGSEFRDFVARGAGR